MDIKEIGITVEQNIPVFNDNRYMTMRCGISLRADVKPQDLQAGAIELQARAEALLDEAMQTARAQAAERLKKMNEQAKAEEDLV